MNQDRKIQNNWRKNYHNLLKTNETPQWYLEENEKNIKSGRYNDMSQLSYKVELLIKEIDLLRGLFLEYVYEDKQEAHTCFCSCNPPLLRTHPGLQHPGGYGLVDPILCRANDQEIGGRDLPRSYPRKVFTSGSCEGRGGIDG